jgi:hypothetical protein
MDHRQDGIQLAQCSDIYPVIRINKQGIHGLDLLLVIKTGLDGDFTRQLAGVVDHHLLGVFVAGNKYLIRICPCKLMG